jgi:hypothetical protein
VLKKDVSRKSFFYGGKNAKDVFFENWLTSNFYIRPYNNGFFKQSNSEKMGILWVEKFKNIYNNCNQVLSLIL